MRDVAINIKALRNLQVSRMQSNLPHQGAADSQAISAQQAKLCFGFSHFTICKFYNFFQLCKVLNSATN